MHGLKLKSFIPHLIKMESKRRHTSWTWTQMGDRERKRKIERAIQLSLSRSFSLMRRWYCIPSELLERELKEGYVCMCMVALFDLSKREQGLGKRWARGLPAGRVGSSLGLRESKGNAQSRRESDSLRVTCAYQEFEILDHSFPYKSQSAHSNPIRTWVNNNNLIIRLQSS
jgi:hypothetical protein